MKKDREVEKENILIHSVKVRMISIRWLMQGGKTFLDLVDTLNETSNKAIMSSKFVSVLLSGFWEKYSQEILWTQFVPYLAYLCGMLTFLLYMLTEKLEGYLSDLLYFPLFGWCVVFIAN